MNHYKKDKILKIVFTAVTVLFISFIFLNSLQPAVESGEKSMFVLEKVQQMITWIGWQITVTEHFIRKAAHFSEYMILGILLIKTGSTYSVKLQRYLFPVLFTGLAVPVADESIQLFVEGRSGQVSDVVLDFSGVFIGILIFLIIKMIRQKVYKKR